MGTLLPCLFSLHPVQAVQTGSPLKFKENHRLEGSRQGEQHLGIFPQVSAERGVPGPRVHLVYTRARRAFSVVYKLTILLTRNQVFFCLNTASPSLPLPGTPCCRCLLHLTFLRGSGRLCCPGVTERPALSSWALSVPCDFVLPAHICSIKTISSP